MNLDVVILSFAKNDALKNITESCIKSLFESETEINFNVWVYESESSLKPYQYPGTETIYLDEKFNYNRFMNYGFQKGTADYVAFCNNDLIFTKDWANNLLKTMQAHKINSASPLDSLYYSELANQGIIKGYEVGKIVAGWCIVVNRKFFENLGGFNDYVRFYCSDNVYAEQLKRKGEMHALITNSIVNHLGNHPTVESLNETQFKELVVKDVKSFNKINYQDILGMGI